MTKLKENSNEKPLTAPKTDPRSMPLSVTSIEDVPAAKARAFTRPSNQAAVTLFDIGKGYPNNVADLIHELDAQALKINRGDMGRAEEILNAQAHTLDALFNHLTRAALASELLNQYEIKFKLALRAQSQCRATLETLAAIKNPPTIFAKQANITSGPQQINNGPLTRAKEIENEPNKQLQHNSSKWLDTGTQGSAGGINPHMEAVGAVNRPQDLRGQSSNGTQRLQRKRTVNTSRSSKTTCGTTKKISGA